MLSPKRFVKNVLKNILFTLQGVPRELDAQTLPWIDKDKADIDGFLSEFKNRNNVSYDLLEKLHFWQVNGFVVLPGIIPVEWLDQLSVEVDQFLEHPEGFETTVVVDSTPGNQKAKNVPRSVLKGPGVRINDFYQLSIAAKKAMLHPDITTFLEAVFNDTPVGMQSLNYINGSQQEAHMDFPFVISGIPSHLAAAWFALEDVHPDAGPLFYYVGSHKCEKFNWGNGILYKPGESTRTPVAFSSWLENRCRAHGYERKSLLIKKGDVLIWHGALVHGGSAINDPSKTRKSYICHYSSRHAYPSHRAAPDEDPVEYRFANGICYLHPTLRADENRYNEGEKFSPVVSGGPTNSR